MKWNEMKWNEMKWNGMKWYEMKWNEMNEWNEMKWNEMKWNEMKWNEMKWNEMKWNEMKWNEMKWNEMKWNEMKWNKMMLVTQAYQRRFLLDFEQSPFSLVVFCSVYSIYVTVPPRRSVIRLSPFPVSSWPSRFPPQTCLPLRAAPPGQKPRLVNKNLNYISLKGIQAFLTR